MHDETADRRPVRGAAVRVEGVVDPAFGFEQFADATMVRRSIDVATPLLQAGVQMGAQHLVIAIRAALVDRDREQLIAFEVFEDRTAVRASCHAIAQVPGEHR